jgi:hypothetical protein
MNRALEIGLMGHMGVMTTANREQRTVNLKLARVDETERQSQS